MAEKRPDRPADPSSISPAERDLLLRRLKAVEEELASRPIADAPLVPSPEPKSLTSAGQEEETPSPSQDAEESAPPTVNYSPFSSTGNMRHPDSRPEETAKTDEPKPTIEPKRRVRRVPPLSIMLNASIVGKSKSPTAPVQKPSVESKPEIRKGWSFDDNPDWDVRKESKETPQPKKPAPKIIDTDTAELPALLIKSASRVKSGPEGATPRSAGEKRRKLPLVMALSALALAGGGITAVVTRTFTPVEVERPTDRPKDVASANNRPMETAQEEAATQQPETTPTIPDQAETTPKEVELKPGEKHGNSDKQDTDDKRDKPSEKKEKSKPKVTELQSDNSSSAPAASAPKPASPAGKKSSKPRQSTKRSSTKKAATKPASSSRKRTSTKKTVKKTAKIPRKTGAARYGDKKLEKKKRFPRDTGGATPHHPDEDGTISGS